VVFSVRGSEMNIDPLAEKDSGILLTPVENWKT
jgi:hypothetical protein